MMTASSVVIFTAFLARPMISALCLLILWLWLLVCNFFLLVGLFFSSYPFLKLLFAWLVQGNLCKCTDRHVNVSSDHE